jgi:hypothetical protein
VDAPFFETPREANPFIFLAMHLKPNKEIWWFLLSLMSRLCN